MSVFQNQSRFILDLIVPALRNVFRKTPAVNQGLRVIGERMRADDAKIHLEIFHRRKVCAGFVMPLVKHSGIQPAGIRPVSFDGTRVENVLRRIHVLPGDEAEVAGQRLMSPGEQIVQPPGKIRHGIVTAKVGQFDSVCVMPVLMWPEEIGPRVVFVGNGKNAAMLRRFR